MLGRLWEHTQELRCPFHKHTGLLLALSSCELYYLQQISY